MAMEQESRSSVADYVPADERPTRQRQSLLLNLVHLFEVYGLLILAVLLLVVFSLLLPRTFPTQLTAAAILQETSTVALLALGQTIVIASGNFDLSIGYAVDICAVLSIGLQRSGLPWPVVVAIVLALGLGIGLVNGLLVEYARIDSFIATLGVGTIMYGIANWYSGGRQIVATLPPAFLAINQTSLLGIPLPAWYVVVFTLLFWVLLEFLPIGRYLYGVGSNRRAAELVGVRARRYVIGAFLVSGFTTAFTGVVLASRLQVGQSSVGPEYLLPAFVGALLGATTIKPGRVNALGTVVAVLILAIGIAGLQQLGGQFFVEPLFNGSTLIVAVGLAAYAARRRQQALSAQE
ncbi:MAG TPA: ABC transporter permease [Chloroflexota bacterium]